MCGVIRPTNGYDMKINKTYLLFTAGTTEAEARDRYLQRIGSEPEKVEPNEEHPKLLVAGPVEKDGGHA